MYLRSDRCTGSRRKYRLPSSSLLAALCDGCDIVQASVAASSAESNGSGFLSTLRRCLSREICTPSSVKDDCSSLPCVSSRPARSEVGSFCTLVHNVVEEVAGSIVAANIQHPYDISVRRRGATDTMWILRRSVLIFWQFLELIFRHRRRRMNFAVLVTHEIQL